MTRLVLLALAGALGCDRAPAPPPAPTPVSRDAAVWPEPTISSDEVLTIAARKLSDTRYELHLGTGVILLELSDNGSLAARDPVTGGAALDVLARWLHQPVPIKTHTQPLVPVSFEVIPLGDGDNKVFFTVGAEYAEMYINLKDATRVEFVPKDPDYAGALVDVFADALRDGPAPPRTPASDPNLESDRPLFPEPHPLAVVDVHRPFCAADGWVAFQADDRRETVVRVPWGGGLPVKLCTLPGAVETIAVGSRSPNAVAVVSARSPTSAEISGPASLWSIDRAGCHRIATPASVELTAFTEPVLSPDGTQVAVTDSTSLAIMPVGAGKTIVTRREDLIEIYAWDDDGLQLLDIVGRKREKLQPGKPATAIDTATSSSPDGAYTAVMVANGLDMFDRTKHTLAHFTPHLRGDIRAIERAKHTPPPWLAPHRLLLLGVPDIAVDAATLRSRPLVRTGTFVCASPDGAHALFGDEEHLSESP